MKKTKLLEIIPSLNKVGGAEVFFSDFVKEITKNHNEVILQVVVLYADENSYLIEDLKNKNINITFLNKHKGIDLKCAKKLRTIIKKFNPDSIHTHLDSLATLILALRFRKKYRIFHTVHNIVDAKFKKEKLVRFLIKNKFIIPIAVSKETALSVENSTNCFCDYINNGIDTMKFSSNICYDLRKIDFICVASFTNVKNQKFLINCLKSINKNCSVVFLGTGPNLECCKNEAKNVKKCKISFLGHVQNVNEYLGNAKCLILPSISEGNPLVLNEAVSSGTYIIASNVGGVKDVVKNEDFGILCEPNNSKDFVDSIYFVLEHQKEISVRLTKRDVSSLQTTSKMVEQYLSIFMIKNYSNRI